MLDDNNDGDTVELSQEGKEASMWLGRLNRGLRAEEVAGLEAWLKTASHRHIILDMARLNYGPDIVAVLSELFPAGPEPMQSEIGKTLLRALVTTGAAVGLAFLAITGQQPWDHLYSSWLSRHETCGKQTQTLTTGSHGAYGTAIGGQRQLILPDNSTVTLNTNTCMGVAFAPHMRVVLLPYGEATFHVAHDPKRPFLVRAGRGRHFEAVGTDFNVRVLSPDQVELTVREGDVKVVYSHDPSEEETPAEARLRANRMDDDTIVGPQVTVLVEPEMLFARKLESDDVEALLAWQQGLLVFKEQSLEEVLAEVDRYTTTRFVLADPRLGSIRIGGRFHTGDIDGLLASLRRDFAIDSRRDAQGRVVLSSLAHAKI
jgi:transmembrane sensor